MSSQDELTLYCRLSQLFVFFLEDKQFTAGKIDEKDNTDSQDLGGIVFLRAEESFKDGSLEGKVRNQKLVKDPSEKIKSEVASPLSAHLFAGVAEGPVFIEDEVADDGQKDTDVIGNDYLLAEYGVIRRKFQAPLEEVVGGEINDGADCARYAEFNKLFGCFSVRRRYQFGY